MQKQLIHFGIDSLHVLFVVGFADLVALTDVTAFV